MVRGESIKFNNCVSNAALWKFTYNKGNNKANIEKLESKKTLDIPKTGTMTITITDNGYVIDVNSGQIIETIESHATNVDKNAIGFFTDHYSHACNLCGYFKISDIDLKVGHNY